MPNREPGKGDRVQVTFQAAYVSLTLDGHLISIPPHNGHLIIPPDAAVEVLRPAMPGPGTVVRHTRSSSVWTVLEHLGTEANGPEDYVWFAIGNDDSTTWHELTNDPRDTVEIIWRPEEKS